MKILVDPMMSLRAAAEEKINSYFNQQAAFFAQQDSEHDTKRRLARDVIDGGRPSPEFTTAAEIEGVDVRTLARTILSKPDNLMLRANERRTKILATRAATTPAAIDALLVGIWTDPARL